MNAVLEQQHHAAGDWYSVPDLRLRDHRFTVPLDHTSPSSHTISVFAREVVAVGKEEQPLPYLLYLQGGPGFESPRPTEASGWLKKACEEYRVILLDQRGTGLSTPLTVSSLSQMTSAEQLVEYVKHFRADSIVNDAEFIRVCLVPDGGPWTILGQSFGGFCVVTYLSFAPKGLQCALITGGLPPIGKGCTADAVYRACFEQILHQNEKYYKRFPQDVEVVREVVNHLTEVEGGKVLLPSGGTLTPRGLQTLGLSGLGSSTGFERLHYMFERVWDPTLVPGAQKRLSYFFLKAILHMKYRMVQLHIHAKPSCQEKQSVGPISNWRKQPNAILMLCIEAKLHPTDRKFVGLIFDLGRHLPNSRLSSSQARENDADILYKPGRMMQIYFTSQGE